MNFSFPYGKTHLTCTLSSNRVVGVLKAKQPIATEGLSSWELVAKSMERPYGTPSLEELAKGKKKVVLIASDHTRPVPSKIIVPQMLAAIRRGNPSADITILIATGCHRATTRQELAAKFGQALLDAENIIIHDCEDEASLVPISTLPSGGTLLINRIAAEADLLVSEGFIEPHFFAGFSGGRKSVLPGIASRSCVHYNHNGAFINHPHARTGILQDNPIHRDMLYAARAAKLAFIVNVVLSDKGEVLASFAGDCDEAHLAGVRFVNQQMRCTAAPADIVITSNNGYPLDQNLYQMVKGMCTAEATCRDRGVIIAMGQCADGVGGEHFLDTFRRYRSIQQLWEDFCQTPPPETQSDQWQSQILARILLHHPVIVISSLDPSIIRDMHMIPAASIDEALQLAQDLLHKPNASITVIPEGISVIVSSEK